MNVRFERASESKMSSAESLFVIPSNDGIHSSAAALVGTWSPSCDGMTTEDGN